MKKVLVIEDDPEIVNLLEIHLKDLSCDVTKAFDGKSGVEMALQDDPDLIILDITLPEMDGIEVCQKIRARKMYRSLCLQPSQKRLTECLDWKLVPTTTSPNLSAYESSLQG